MPARKMTNGNKFSVVVSGPAAGIMIWLASAAQAQAVRERGSSFHWWCEYHLSAHELEFFPAERSQDHTTIAGGREGPHSHATGSMFITQGRPLFGKSPTEMVWHGDRRGGLGAFVVDLATARLRPNESQVRSKAMEKWRELHPDGWLEMTKKGLELAGAPTPAAAVDPQYRPAPDHLRQYHVPSAREAGPDPVGKITPAAEDERVQVVVADVLHLVLPSRAAQLLYDLRNWRA